MKLRIRYIAIPLFAALAGHLLTGFVYNLAELNAKAHAYEASGCQRYEQAMNVLAVYKLPTKGDE